MAKTTPSQFIDQVRTEARKVVWPSREETVRVAIFVFFLMLLLSVFFLGIDTLFGETIAFLLSLL